MLLELRHFRVTFIVFCLLVEFSFVTSSGEPETSDPLTVGQCWENVQKMQGECSDLEKTCGSHSTGES